jgi:hypothetical protein
MVRETRLTLDGLIEPHFACPGDNVRREVASMPGCAQMSVDVLVEECKRSFDLGIPSIILFGIPSAKDAVGSEGYARDGIVPRAIEAVKEGVPDLVVWADVCMCEYTDHGHCGVLKGEEVDNDATLPLLAKAALAYAQAGADGVAPSDMMDGRVTAIRETLDESGYEHIPIMSYAAKFASAFYGPFRDAAESTPQFGDRRAYRARSLRRADRLLQRQRRVLDGQSGGAKRLDRRGSHHSGNADRVPPRRGGHHPHILRARRRTAPTHVMRYLAQNDVEGSDAERQPPDAASASRSAQNCDQRNWFVTSWWNMTSLRLMREPSAFGERSAAASFAPAYFSCTSVPRTSRMNELSLKKPNAS